MQLLYFRFDYLQFRTKSIFVSPGMIRTGTGGSGNLMFKSASSSVVESRANNEMMTEQKSGVAGSAPWSPTSGMPIVEMATVESKESKKSFNVFFPYRKCIRFRYHRQI